jgi:hypothetical protein
MTTLAHSTTQKHKHSALLSLATIAIVMALTAGYAYSQAGRTPSAQDDAAQSSDRIGAAEASRVVPCLMPAAWRRGCGQ